MRHDGHVSQDAAPPDHPSAADTPPSDTSPSDTPPSNNLPADNHVHSEWSWDTFGTSMVDTCARAVELGLPSIAFTEHVDATSWIVVSDKHLPDHWQRFVSDGVFTPPQVDVEGYLNSVADCRERFPSLRILSGVELGEPHWHADSAAATVRAVGADRILASLHSSPTLQESSPHETPDVAHVELSARFSIEPPAQVIRDYLAEVARMIETSSVFQVLAHIDYPLRYWPHDRVTFDPADFEDDYRHTLGLLAASGRAMELNTRLPMPADIVRWWYDVGGDALSFGSDAHTPAQLARGFREATAVAEAAGFCPGRDPLDFWRRG